MIRKLVTALSLLLFLSSLVVGGVVLELEITDLPDTKGPIHRIYAQGEMLRLEVGEGDGPTVIFRDEALIILNDKERTYSRMDEEQAQALGAQLSAMMQQMKGQLDKLPAEQRAMAESLMKSRLPEQGSLPDIKIEEAGSEEIGEYSCQKYVVYQNGTKTGEIFSAPVEAASESMEAFHAMARFSTKLLQPLQNTPLAELGNHPLRLLDQVDGFPILSREFRDGRAVRETALKSAMEKDLAADLFAPPKDYKQADLMSMGL
jgi:hypothetical protein